MIKLRNFFLVAVQLILSVDGNDPRLPDEWGSYRSLHTQLPPPAQDWSQQANVLYEQQQQQEGQSFNGQTKGNNSERKRPSRLKARSAGFVTTGALGVGLSKTITGSVRPRWALWGAMANGMMQVAGGRFGELADATGVTTLESLRRLHLLSASGSYPIFKQFKCALGLAPRRRFPPESDDPWRYSRNSPPFSMFRCIIGAICLAGTGVAFMPLPPFVPTSLIAIVAAFFAVFSVTLRDARGDAARCLVARAVAMVSIILASANQAHLASAAAAALRLSGDRLSNFDKRFGISRRIAATIAQLSRGTSAPQQRQQYPPRENAPYQQQQQQQQWTPQDSPYQQQQRGQQQYSNGPQSYPGRAYGGIPPEHDWM
uniref:Uncharacterized protein n=1 Tax=Aureoumbra lagunensis TaxID=44058 RepID=A0A7S3JUB8_9STRA